MIHRSPSSSAFSLVEVVIALGVAVFALIAIFGLLPVGLQSSRGAIEQTAANGLLTAVAADLRASEPGATTSDMYGITIPSEPTDVSAANAQGPLYFDAEGGFSTTQQAGSRYRLAVDFVEADSASSPHQAMLEVTWPAPAKPEDAAGRVKMFVAFDRTQ